MPRDLTPCEPACEPSETNPGALEPTDSEGADGDPYDAGAAASGDRPEPIGLARPCVLESSPASSRTQIVPAGPVLATPPPLPIAGPHYATPAVSYGSPGAMIVAPPREGCSVASAICGITGFIPFISQAAGLGLGIAGLIRIKRARDRGVALRGVGWAVTGLSTSVFGLLCWIGVFAGLVFLRSTIQQATAGLDVLNLPVK